MADESICRGCFHSYVCEQFNEHRDSNNKKCHFFNDHFVSAADVVEVRHGRWVSYDLDVTFSCSECDFTTDFRLSNYCPECGAYMRGE